MSNVSYSYIANIATSQQGSISNINATPTYPNGSGIIDIVNDYPWKNKQGGRTDEVPYVYLIEYELPFGQILKNFVGIFDAAKKVVTSLNENSTDQQLQDPTSGADPYGKIYSVKRTNFSYVFPYLKKPGDSLVGKTTNDWKRTSIFDMAYKIAGSIPYIGKIAGAATKFGSFEATAAGVGIEDIVSYSNTNARQINITFPLYNTLDVGYALKNYDFVQFFKFQNLKQRTSFTTFLPPKVYTLEMPGVGGIYMPLAFVKELDIQSIGTTRLMRDDRYNNLSDVGGTTGILLPEAYKVSITLEEFLPESQNIMLGSIGGDRVQVFSTQ